MARLLFSIVLCIQLCVLIGNVISNRCNPSPCGPNTTCYVDPQTKRPVCICLPKFKGSPIERCDPVPEDEADICVGACAPYASCEVIDKQPSCKCPPAFLGDGVFYCAPECTAQHECPAHLACLGNHCGDPCDANPKPCGKNADCRVKEHNAICKCPKGYKGHPFEECTPRN